MSFVCILGCFECIFLYFECVCESFMSIMGF